MEEECADLAFSPKKKVEGDLKRNSGAGNVILLGMRARCSQSHQSTEQGEKNDLIELGRMS